MSIVYVENNENIQQRQVAFFFEGYISSGLSSAKVVVLPWLLIQQNKQNGNIFGSTLCFIGENIVETSSLTEYVPFKIISPSVSSCIVCVSYSVIFYYISSEHIYGRRGTNAIASRPMNQPSRIKVIDTITNKKAR